jgi:hypothetical protein
VNGILPLRDGKPGFIFLPPEQLTVPFETAGYKELAAGVVLGEHLITPVGG